MQVYENQRKHLLSKILLQSKSFDLSNENGIFISRKNNLVHTYDRHLLNTDLLVILKSPLILTYGIKSFSRFGVAVQYVSNFFQRILIANLMD